MRLYYQRAMSSKNTFTIPPILKILKRYIKPEKKWIDPFANNNTIKKIGFYHVITNDINLKYDTDYNLDAIEFIQKMGKVDGILYDPPYSPRKLKECYDGIGQSLNQLDTSSKTWSKWRTAIKKAINPGGIVISFGWNSTGIGKKNGFEKIEIFLIGHGSSKHDTIVVIEKRINNDLDNYFTVEKPQDLIV